MVNQPVPGTAVGTTDLDPSGPPWPLGKEVRFLGWLVGWLVRWFVSWLIGWLDGTFEKTKSFLRS